MLSSTIYLELAVLSYLHHGNLALSANYLLLKHRIANIAYPMIETVVVLQASYSALGKVEIRWELKNIYLFSF